MREKLRELGTSRRMTFTASVQRFGTKPGRHHPRTTILLTNVRGTAGEKLTGHIWLTQGAWSQDLKPGDRIRFDARIKTYHKGYHDQLIDYRLTNPTNVRRLEPRSLQSLPLWDLAGTPQQANRTDDADNQRLGKGHHRDHLVRNQASRPARMGQPRDR